MRKYLIIAISTLFFAGCAEVKSYQKSHVNNDEMKLSPRKVETFDNSIESYREGASGANGGKTGGGCGCN